MGPSTGSGPKLPRTAWRSLEPGPGSRCRGAREGLEGPAALGLHSPAAGKTRGKARDRGSGAAAGPLERRERRGREEGARRRREAGRGGRRERGRQAEGGLISMQQRSRAGLHCFNTSPLLRANLSPFSRRTLLPQMLLFSNETDN